MRPPGCPLESLLQTLPPRRLFTGMMNFRRGPPSPRISSTAPGTAAHLRRSWRTSRRSRDFRASTIRRILSSAAAARTLLRPPSAIAGGRSWLVPPQRSAADVPRRDPAIPSPRTRTRSSFHPPAMPPGERSLNPCLENPHKPLLPRPQRLKRDHFGIPFRQIALGTKRLSVSHNRRSATRPRLGVIGMPARC